MEEKYASIVYFGSCKNMIKLFTGSNKHNNYM